MDTNQEKKYIGVIAQDGKKAEMVAFLMENQTLLTGARLVAIGTMGKYVKQAEL